MVSERNRVIELKEYLSSLGICVNIGKTKARGNNGVFMHRFDNFRIDVSGKVKQEEILSVILHEFAHYIHYSYDKTLNSLDFIFSNYDDELKEELIKITVNEIPKDFAVALYSEKDKLKSEIKELSAKIKIFHPDFKLAQTSSCLDKLINYPLKYLLKYDRVKYLGKLYSVHELDDYKISEDAKLYLLIKSKQRAVNRINSKISKLNRYYNSPSELFARFLESYYTKSVYTKSVAPTAYSYINKSENPYIKKLNKIFL